MIEDYNRLLRIKKRGILFNFGLIITKSYEYMHISYIVAWKMQIHLPKLTRANSSKKSLAELILRLRGGGEWESTCSNIRSFSGCD